MRNILIVEDDPEIAMLERDYLEIAGFATQLASDGRAAEEAALSGAFDLILLDLMLPDRWTRSGAWAWGRTTTSPSPSTRRSWWPG